ncbi:hypothetical protein FRC11_000189, partial [Ceratobasidium sp. 423]
MTGFVPARARLSEIPAETAVEHLDFGPLKRLSKEIGKFTPKRPRERERQRQLIIPLPDSEPQDVTPHLTSSQPHFSSPPLLSGLVSQVHELLGIKAKPTPVQKLSLAHFFRDGSVSGDPNGTLLAAETGSGK